MLIKIELNPYKSGVKAFLHVFIGCKIIVQ